MASLYAVNVETTHVLASLLYHRLHTIARYVVKTLVCAKKFHPNHAIFVVSCLASVLNKLTHARFVVIFLVPVKRNVN